MLLTPLAVVRHAAGAMWGAISPVEGFEVTEKVTPDTVEAVNERLEEGDLAANDGSERLTRDEEGEFDWGAFDD